jgi:hypothetical protein
MDSMAKVVESAKTKPQIPPGASEAEELTRDLIQRLTERHGESFVASLALLAKPLDPKVDRVQACTAITEMYREIRTMSEPARGKLLRHLLGSGGE